MTGMRGVTRAELDAARARGGQVLLLSGDEGSWGASAAMLRDVIDVARE